MRKLELKDIKSYIDTDLICKCDKWEQPQVLTGARTNGILYFGEIGGADLCVDDVKPYLYSMDWLTKPITHKGESFVPIVELGKLCGYDKLEKYEEDAIITYGWCDYNGDDYSGYTFSWYEKDRCFAIWGDEIEGEPYYLTNTVLSVFDKLSEWHFDFNGLLDAGLAIPVTNEFNPYKL